MFSFLRPRTYEHYVDNGCVHCPRRGHDVELDLCAGCEWLSGIHLEARPGFVRCRATPMPEPLMRIRA